MTIESRIRNVRSLGYQRQQWPKASHYVVRIGRREARVIVETGETVPFAGLAAMLAAGLNFLAIPTMKMNLVNLTPHNILVLAENGRDVLATFHPDGTVARVTVTREIAGHVAGIPTYRTSYGAVTGLPAPTPGVRFIVSLLVKQAAPERGDLLAPGELVRGADGQPVGCKGFTA